MALENAVQTVILVSQLHMAAEKFHSPIPEVKEMSSVTAVRHVM